MSGHIVVVATASPTSSKSAAIPLSKFCELSPLLDQIIKGVGSDTSALQTIGPVNLPFIGVMAFEKVRSFVHTNTMVVGTLNSSATQTSNNTITCLVELSAFAYVFDIASLQRMAIHGLWHALVVNFEAIDSQQLALSNLDSLLASGVAGCPAHEIVCFVRQKL